MRGKLTREVWSARVKVNAFSEAEAMCAALDWALSAQEDAFEFQERDTEGGARERLERGRRWLLRCLSPQADVFRGFEARVDWTARAGEGPGSGQCGRRRELSVGELEETGRLWGAPDAVEIGEGNREALAAATRAAAERDEMDAEIGRGASAGGAERL